MNYVVLASERKNDPLLLGYTGVDGHDLNLLNSADVTAALVSRASIGKNDFLKLTLAASVRCKTLIAADNSALNSVVASKWYEVVLQARAADPGSTIDLTLVANVGDPVLDKVMTQAESDALLKRHPTRAEVLGLVIVDEILTLDDMARGH